VLSGEITPIATQFATVYSTITLRRQKERDIC